MPEGKCKPDTDAPFRPSNHMLGYFSVEWVFLAAIGLVASASFSEKFAHLFGSQWSGSLAVIAITFLFYALLRVTGRTPIGITYHSHPAARGHPILSLFAALTVLGLLGYPIWNS